jgi:Lon protease-like protein
MLFDEKIPLFPLGLVLFPEMPLPLHIFEERYKRMVQECLARDSEFGVVYFSGKEIQNKGCSARILDVSKRYDDGRMDILTRGVRRFVVEELDQSLPYLQSTVRYFDDALDLTTEEMKRLAAKGIDLLEELSSLTQGLDLQSFKEDLGVESISFLLASSDGFTFEEKQKFLEMTSTHERLAKCVKALEKIITRAKLTREVQRIIDGNGKVTYAMRKQLRYDGG